MKYFTLLFFAFFLFSCISSKKHLEEISALRNDHEASLSKLKFRLDAANYSIDSLGLVIAQKNGENAALLTVQDKLQERIDGLQDQIDNVTDLALNQKQSLKQTIEERDLELENKKNKLKDIQLFLESTQNESIQLMNLFRDRFSDLDSLKQATFTINGSNFHMAIKSDIFFSEGQHKVNSKSNDILKEISDLLTKNPAFFLTIVGHTDNGPIKSKAYRDSWDLSTLRAASIAQLLTKEFGTNNSQVLAGGKGEFQPVTSNETEDGRSQNERIEFIFSKGNEFLIRDLKRKLEAN